MIQKLLANFVGRLLYTTPAAFAPGKSKTYKTYRAKFNLDMSVYDTWTRETLHIQNGDYTIPAELVRVAPPRGLAIVAHGFGENRYAMSKHAELMQKLGFSTIVFDQRRFGASRIDHGTMGWKEATDVAAMIRWSKENLGADTRVVLIGCSMGAITSMNALRYTDQIDAVIEDSGPAVLTDILDPFYAQISKRKNPYLYDACAKAAEKADVSMEDNRPIDAVANSNVPILCIGSQGDVLIPAADAEKICSVSKNPLSRFEIFGNKPHALSILDYNHYTRIVTEFLDDTVPIQNK